MCDYAATPSFILDFTKKVSMKGFYLSCDLRNMQHYLQILNAFQKESMKEYGIHVMSVNMKQQQVYALKAIKNANIIQYNIHCDVCEYVCATAFSLERHRK